MKRATQKYAGNPLTILFDTEHHISTLGSETEKQTELWQDKICNRLCSVFEPKGRTRVLEIIEELIEDGFMCNREALKLQKDARAKPKPNAKRVALRDPTEEPNPKRMARKKKLEKIIYPTLYYYQSMS